MKLLKFESRNPKQTGHPLAELPERPTRTPARLRARGAISVALALSCLLVEKPRETQAVTVRLDTRAASVRGAPGVFNPGAVHGLQAVASQSADYSYEEPPPSSRRLQLTAHAAAYGSDSWKYGTGNSVVEALQGLGVEPMADARAFCFSNYGEGFEVWSSAESEIRVAHRILARAFPPELEKILGGLAVIPVRFEFMLHVSVDGPDNPVGEAGASVSVESEDGSFGYSKAIHVSLEGGARTAETNLTTNLSLKRHRTDEVHTYWITAHADARAWGFEGLSGEAQAVADPLLQVKPDWEYAPYFVVVQESANRPGEWIEITREWQDIQLRPALAVTRTNSSWGFSWPASAGAFALQTTASLSPPVMWTGVTNAPALRGDGQWEVAVPETMAPQSFYRLLSR